jgi:hypothetical protein
MDSNFRFGASGDTPQRQRGEAASHRSRKTHLSIPNDGVSTSRLGRPWDRPDLPLFYSGIRARPVAPSSVTVWRRVSHRALRCGPPACAGKARRRHGWRERPCMQRRFPAASCRLPARDIGEADRRFAIHAQRAARVPVALRDTATPGRGPRIAEHRFRKNHRLHAGV